MKKWVIGVSCTIALISTTAVYASQFSEYNLEAKVVPFAYHLADVNRDTRKGDNYFGSDDTEGLPQSINYKGTQYVPIREIANILSLETDWDSSKKVAILQPKSNTVDKPKNLDALIDLYSKQLRILESMKANETITSINLKFNPLSMSELESDVPNELWKKSKAVQVGVINNQQVTIQYYLQGEKSNGEAFAFIEYGREFYPLGDVGATYGLDNVDVQLINENIMAPNNQQMKLVAAIGTPYTSWCVFGFDESKGQWFVFDTAGRPQVLDLDNDGYNELVATFDGAHLNMPDVSVIRWSQGIFEQAKIAEQIGQSNVQYARLLKNEDGFFRIETGKANATEKSIIYKYIDGRLIED